MAIDAIAGRVAMPGRAIPAIAVLLLAACLCSLGAQLARLGRAGSLEDALAHGFLVAVLLNFAAVVSSLIGWEWQLWRFEPAPPPPRAVGLIGQSNHLATIGALGAASALHLHTRGQLSRRLFIASSVMAATICAASLSRVGLVVWAAMLVLVLVWARGRMNLNRLAALQLGCLAAAVIAWTALGPMTQRALPSPHGSLARSDAGRVEILTDAYRLWSTSPLTGVGSGNFAAARLHALSGPLRTPSVDNAHNLFAHFLAEWGLLGLGLAVVASGILILAVRSSFQQRTSASTGCELLPVTVLVVLALHSMVELPLWSPHFLLPFALCLGLAWKRQPQAAEVQPATRRHRALLTCVGSLICAIAALDYGRLQSAALRIVAETKLPAGSDALVTLGDVILIESTTLFPAPATILLARKVPIGPPAAETKLAIARRAMDAVPHPETIARYCAFAVVARKEADAINMLEALRTRSPHVYSDTVSFLRAWGEQSPTVAAFLSREASR